MGLWDNLNKSTQKLIEQAAAVTATAADKANSAIESGKLNLKIAAEERKITEFTLAIGDLMLDQLDNGETFDDEIMALYSSIQATREVIAGAQAELEANRAAEADPILPPVCAECGLELDFEDNFCPHCGTKVEVPVPEVAEASIVEAQPVDAEPAEAAPEGGPEVE